MSECCGGKTRLVYSCSGCSNVGEIADKAARTLSKEGFGKMTCLAGAGAHLPGFVESAKGADENLVIDGCPVACARKTLEHIGITPKSYVLTEMGLVKGSTPVSESIVSAMTEKIRGNAKSKTAAKDGQSPGCCCSE